MLSIDSGLSDWATRPIVKQNTGSSRDAENRYNPFGAIARRVDGQRHDQRGNEDRAKQGRDSRPLPGNCPRVETRGLDLKQFRLDMPFKILGEAPLVEGLLDEDEVEIRRNILYGVRFQLGLPCPAPRSIALDGRRLSAAGLPP